MSRTVLIIVGILIIAMGLLGLITSYWYKDPVWHAILKIVVGIIAVAVGASDKKAA